MKPSVIVLLAALVVSLCACSAKQVIPQSLNLGVPQSQLSKGAKKSHVRFVYVANGASGNVSAYTLDLSTGALTQIVGSPFPSGNGTTTDFVAVDPTGKFLFLSNVSSNTISVYTIDSASGALTPIAGSPFAAPGAPLGLTVDPSGQFLYVADLANSVSVFSINAGSGAITPVAGSPFAAGDTPTQVTTDPAGRFAFVANLHSNNVSVYAISNGMLTPVAGSPFAAGSAPAGVAVDPSGRFLYVPNQVSGNVSAFTIDGTSGALTPILGSPYPAGSEAELVTVDPSGSFVYVTNVSGNDVSGYAINSLTGALTSLPSSPFGAGTRPRGIVIDPTGTFALVANEVSANVWSYTFDPATGALSPVAGSPFSAGVNPLGIAVTAQGPRGGNLGGGGAGACPQSATIPVSASGGTLSFPSCGGFSGTLTYGVMSAGSSTTFSATTDTSFPTGFAFTPSPSPAPSVVVLYLTFTPAATFTWPGQPTRQITIPASIPTSGKVWRSWFSDLTAGANLGHECTGASVTGQTITFSGTGCLGATLQAGHTYLEEIYY